MTRLVKQDMEKLEDQLQGYDEELKTKTGMTYEEIAIKAAELPLSVMVNSKNELKIAVVPITAGLGVIELFVDSVQAIIKHMGFEVFITEKTDVNGMYEARQKNADIIFIADDDRFLAWNVRTSKISDNGISTGRGFAAALLATMGKLEQSQVLILGVGQVGAPAAEYFLKAGTQVGIYDISEKARDNFKAKYPQVTIEKDLHDALSRYDYIYDATPAQPFIGAKDIKPGSYIAAPGMPLCLKEEARPVFEKELIHDPLQIGVATMLTMVL